MVKFRVALLAVTVAIALWFSGKAMYGFWVYSRLECQTIALIEKWEIRELDPSEYRAIASYSYEVGGTAYLGITELKDPIFLNRPSAEQQILQWENRSWDVWYAKKEPSFSSLEKRLPLKNSVYALLSWAVFIYFWLLLFPKGAEKNESRPE